MRQFSRKSRGRWLLAMLCTLAFSQAEVARAAPERGAAAEHELLTTTTTITARSGNRLQADRRFFAVSRQTVVLDAGGGAMSFADIPLPATAEITFYVQKDVGPVVVELHLR